MSDESTEQPLLPPPRRSRTKAKTTVASLRTVPMRTRAEVAVVALGYANQGTW